MSRRQLAARNEAISNSRSPSPRPSSARGPSGSLDRMGAALGMSPVQSMTPTDGGQAAVPPAKPVGLQHPQPQPASQANKVTTGSAGTIRELAVAGAQGEGGGRGLLCPCLPHPML